MCLMSVDTWGQIIREYPVFDVQIIFFELFELARSVLTHFYLAGMKLEVEIHI